MLVKTADLSHLLAHEPSVQRIETYNAASNRHMLAVNREMGFRAVERWRGWQVKAQTRQQVAHVLDESAPHAPRTYAPIG